MVHSLHIIVQSAWTRSATICDPDPVWKSDMDIRSAAAVSFLLKVKPTWLSKVLLIQEGNLNARHTEITTHVVSWSSTVWVEVL